MFQGRPVQTERGFVLHEPMLAGTEKADMSPPMPRAWRFLVAWP